MPWQCTMFQKLQLVAFWLSACGKLHTPASFQGFLRFLNFILPLFRVCVSGITFSLSVALQVWCYSRQSDKYPARWCYLFLVLSYSLVGLSAAAVFCFLPLVLKLLPSIGQMLSNTETFAYFFQCMPDCDGFFLKGCESRDSVVCSCLQLCMTLGMLLNIFGSGLKQIQKCMYHSAVRYTAFLMITYLEISKAFYKDSPVQLLL